MARTGARAARLKDLLADIGFMPVAKPPPPRLQSLPAGLATEVRNLYAELGGVSEDPVFRPGGWDLAFDGGVVVELDEQLHFNRYRATTLGREWAVSLPWTGDYLAYCTTYESVCLADGRWGKRWTNPSCERLFGVPDPSGVFGVRGAPRWKQRALYDAIKDAAALSPDTRLARLAIYDDVGGVMLDSVLEGRESVDVRALDRLMQTRLAG